MPDELMKFIDINPIVEVAKREKCPFIGIVGGKGTGKTWGCVKWGLDNSNKFTKPFFYVRRFDKTFTKSICGNLVNSHRQDIINMTKGALNHSDFKGKIFTVNRMTSDKNGNEKRTNERIICYCRSLNNVDTETGDDKGAVSCVIFDEFLTRGNELKDEYTKLMIVHNNAIRNRTDVFVPMFLLGNTLTKDSALAEQFGIRMRDIKPGLNIFRNTKGQARIILYYTPQTSMQAESAATYYDRFENDRINMITHGDWILGDYPIATESLLHQTGTKFKFFDRGICVVVVVFAYGYNAFCVVRRPDKLIDRNIKYNVSPIISKNNLALIPDIITECVLKNCYAVETSDIGEDFRDICKHMINGQMIVKHIE